MNDSPSPAERIRTILLQRLSSLSKSGVEQIPRLGRPGVSPPAVGGVAAASPAGAAASSPGSPADAAAALQREPAGQPEAGPGVELERIEPDPAAGDRGGSLGRLREQVSGCVRCNELARTRRQTVFGAGNPRARVCFLGEAPGAEEDRRGEPFVGAAGQLLDRILKACTFTREDVYILNVLKCRPPANRTPNVEEVANCRPYFERQLEIIQPEFICCLGLVAAQSLLRSTQSLRRLRGRFHSFGDTRVLVTYHPAYLLRNPEAKRATWEDMKMLMRAMGIEPP